MRPDTEIHIYGIKAKGKGELTKHLKGERLTHKQAIQAKCYNCMGYYADGKYSCGMPDCSLYPFMPYRETDE
jgi:hypothetical protein